MTNEELLQQAKDQVAQDMGHENWEDLVHIALSGFKTRTGAYLWIEENTWEAAALAIQSAREEAAPKWIPVKERLPERYEDCYTSETVLVYTTSTYTFMGYYNHKVNGWGIIGDENLREIHVVTHWMPKPERPI